MVLVVLSKAVLGRAVSPHGSVAVIGLVLLVACLASSSQVSLRHLLETLADPNE